MGPVTILSKAEQDKMRAAGKLAAQLLDFLTPQVVSGVSTGELDKLAHAWTLEHGAISAPLNYRGFPRSICTSVNEEVCHGIPNFDRHLNDGDIVNVDVTVILDGFHGDTSRMFGIGEVSKKAQKLMDVTYDSMMLGIAEIAPGKRLGDIGAAIKEYAGIEHGYGVVTEFCGHGIGRVFHTEPNVVHVGKRGTGRRFTPGMCFTVEPMLNAGTPDCRMLADAWTAVTVDGCLSAQTEHTILVTEEGHEILTVNDKAEEARIAERLQRRRRTKTP